MKLKAIILAAIVTAMTSNLAAADAYLCVEDVSTGIKWAEGKWQPATFSTLQYVIRGYTEDDPSALGCYQGLDLSGGSTKKRVVGLGFGSDHCYSRQELGKGQGVPTPCKEVWTGKDLATSDKLSLITCNFFAEEVSFAPDGEYFGVMRYWLPDSGGPAGRPTLALSVGHCSQID